MPKILVIEDDTQVRQMIAQMLETAGYESLEAADGEDGIKLYQEESPDLVITDIIMPHQGGLETIMKLKKDHPQVKIFAVTGGGRVVKADFLSIAKSIGALRTFSKPIDRKEIMQAVEDEIGPP